MLSLSLRRASARILTLALLLLTVACSSPPTRFYLLSASASPPPGHTPTQSAGTDIASGSSRARGAGTSRASNASRRTATPLVGVSVTVPEYLNRLDIVERVSANEAKPIHTEQWGEDLSVAATRAVAENLTMLLPAQDVIMLPARSARSPDYQVNLDLIRFESDAEGQSVLTGRWSIADAAGVERASGRAAYSERTTGAGYPAMAATMSRNLGAVSRDIAAALRGLPASAPTMPAKSTSHRSMSNIPASHAFIPATVAGASTR